MSENESDNTPFDDFLRSLLGGEEAEEMIRAMRAQGFDPSTLPPEFSDPAQVRAALSQFSYLMNTQDGPVSWRLVEDGAKQKAYASGDLAPTAAEAEAARQAMTIADLWLDAVTDFSSSTPSREVWSRVQWVERTLPVWKRICEPVALNVSRALTHALTEQFDSDDEFAPELPEDMASMLGRTRQVLPRLSAMMYASQIGEAMSALAQESFGIYDTGLPLASAEVSALVPRTIAEFSDGLDVPFEEVRLFLAVREAAHRRLFSSVSWLERDLIHAVEAYANDISIDLEAMSQAARSVDLSDPSSMESALKGNIFTPPTTPTQKRSLERLETMLALIEGWVDVVTAQATLPYLPHTDALREMMRRRRASGGPVEEILGSLIGLRMNPRRIRGAASIFSLVATDSGRSERDALWAHPDVVPTSTELDTPDTFLTLRRAASEQDADIDAALNSLLDGTMGWAEGLEPGSDEE